MEITQEFLERQGYKCVRQMKDRRWIGLDCTFIYTTGLVVGLNEFGYDYRYCYEKYRDALIAVSQYEGEGDPIGPWIKRKGEGGEKMGPGAKGGI